MLYSARYTQTTRAQYGDISPLITEDLTSIANDSYHIAIVGPNGSGKIGIAKTLSEKTGYNYMVSDDFIADLDPSVHDYRAKSALQIQPRTRNNATDAMYSMLDMVMEHKSPLIYVGSLVPRLLRAGLRDQMYVPDTVIVVECDENTLRLGHNMRNHSSKLQANLNAYKGQKKVLNEWNEMLNKDMLIPYPLVLKLDTSVL